MSENNEQKEIDKQLREAISENLDSKEYRIVSAEEVEEDERLCKERTDEVLERVSAARLRLLSKVPFFGTLTIKLIPRLARMLDNVHTAAISPDGTLTLNYDFVMGLTDEELCGILCHEVMHPAYLFWERKSTRSHMQFNVAHDHAINLIIKEFDSSLIKLPENTLADPKYTGISAEEIYDLISKESAKKQLQMAYGKQNGGSSNDKDSKNGQGGGKRNQDSGGEAGDGEADGSMGDCRPDLSSTKQGKDAARGDSAAKRRMETDWKSAIVEAAMRHERDQKARGTLPGSLRRFIDELIEPKVDWRDALARYIGEKGQRNDYSYRRPSRRSDAVGEFMPSKFASGADVAVLMDTSGSMSKDRLVEGATEINSICEDLGVSVRLMICDADLYHDVEVEDGYESMDFMVGGGGSDFNPAFDRLVEDGFDGVVIAITDGMIAVPEIKPPQIRDTLWLLNKGERPPTTAWGTVLEIE